MLPMRRRVVGLNAGLLFALIALAGCRNQSGAITNPFLQADRVPPPPTRVLTPGTAQPLYPGEAGPGAAVMGAPGAGAPVVGAPGASIPGATTVPAGSPTYAPSGYPPTSPGLTTPPNNWAYPPQSGVTPTSGINGDAVSVPSDQQGLRFAAAESASPPAASAPADVAALNANSSGVNPAAYNVAATAPASVRLPIQSILPGGVAEPTRLGGQRDVTAAEYLAGQSSGGVQQASTAASMTPAGRDGFRPQGSAPRSTAESDNVFRRPNMRGTTAVPASDPETARFAAGENYESLRGQLEYWPTSGEWSLRYVEEGAPVDSLGGRVMIDNAQVLANLQPGEMVAVRGTAYARTTEDGASQAAYRVSAVQRQRY
jgi:hypothetical protein